MSNAPLLGKTFGRWTVIDKGGNNSLCRFVEVQCQCGTVKHVFGKSVGVYSLSCGCFKSDVTWMSQKPGYRGMTEQTKALMKEILLRDGVRDMAAIRREMIGRRG